jgi:hypothetical protein
VYIDSRPEAYSNLFIREDYIRPFVDEDLWEPLLLRYNFEVICFVPASDWETDFLNRRARDPAWAMIYFEPQEGVILVRRIPKFAKLIERIGRR